MRSGEDAGESLENEERWDEAWESLKCGDGSEGGGGVAEVVVCVCVSLIERVARLGSGAE